MKFLPSFFCVLSLLLTLPGQTHLPFRTISGDLFGCSSQKGSLPLFLTKLPSGAYVGFFAPSVAPNRRFYPLLTSLHLQSPLHQVVYIPSSPGKGMGKAPKPSVNALSSVQSPCSPCAQLLSPGLPLPGVQGPFSSSSHELVGFRASFPWLCSLPGGNRPRG